MSKPVQSEDDGIGDRDDSECKVLGMIKNLQARNDILRDETQSDGLVIDCRDREWCILVGAGK